MRRAKIEEENSALYPIFLSLAGRTCAIVGGGPVAARKARRLRESGAAIRVISPETTSELAGLADHVLLRPYEKGDLEGAYLAFAATNSRETNAAVVLEANERGIPVNVADSPAEGDFTVPSTLRRGGLQVAVSTGGASPTLARRVRLELEDVFGPEWEGIVERLGEDRRSGVSGEKLEEEVGRCLSRLSG